MQLKNDDSRPKGHAKYSLSKSNVVQDSIFPTCSRNLYWEVIKKTEKPSTSIFEYEHLFPSHGSPWKDIFQIPRSFSLDSKIRKLQYKVLNRMLYANKPLFKMGIVDSPLCSFCQASEESLEHEFDTVQYQLCFGFVVEWLENYFPAIRVLTGVNSIVWALWKRIAIN